MQRREFSSVGPVAHLGGFMGVSCETELNMVLPDPDYILRVLLQWTGEGIPAGAGTGAQETERESILFQKQD